ncbi:hypothetical protein A5658_12870 [Mycobacterium sp. 1245111.1]|uniref:TetR/AcrR family transcriptional regulator n=1 Tax=Mycobacterium sp. 1245111.1 TaxID=1834073 RepID=UPI0007FBE160|nr:TetR/AcrR family transcriptional regulator [Mycobacterium sp. 1245111.1]OBK33737.1 hypothetical protein A5658_12870 [Mycobacterium sp. 1245111.1]
MPPTSTPNDLGYSGRERSRASLRRLLAAAEHVLINGGTAKFTVARVAEQAGVSVAMVYRRFAGKKDLVAAVQADLQERLRVTISSALEKPSASLGEVLHAFTDALGQVLDESGPVISALLDSRTCSPPTQPLATTNSLAQQFLAAADSHRLDVGRADPTAALTFTFHTIVAAATYRAAATPPWPDNLSWQQWADEIGTMTSAYLHTRERSLHTDK